jgi:dTDP-4-dehydrorhamnose 3,5-epimerase
VPIKVVDTKIIGVKIITGIQFYDERGFFTEKYKESEFETAGIPRFVQDNLSESSKGVIRGLHWQEPPFEQGKLVSCLTGSIIDVALDIRKGSQTFGQHVSILLTETESCALWIPPGFAHGFQSLEDNTKVHYKVTQYWNKDSEKSLNPIHPSLRISWSSLTPTISQKDLNGLQISDLT